MTAPTSLPPELVSALAANYELLQEIGRGGMGVVYAGRDVRLDRLVAIKVLPDLVASAEVRERFLREARAAARLSHPSIVPIYSADDRDGVTFLVMAYVDGPTLSTRIRSGGTLSPDDAIPILRDIASALGAAHARGVVHRDIKPENVLVDRVTGRAMVTDFGIARLADAMTAGALTRTGQVLGTVGYMSPEQVTGGEVDGRSDLYSLGVLAFEALSGRLPFEGSAPVVIVAHATRMPPPLASLAPGVSAELCAIVDRCLAKNPADRFASGDDLARALQQLCGSANIGAPLALAREADGRILTEREAERVWQRAAELQAGIGSSTPLRAPTAAVSIVPRTPSNGFRMEHVRDAAIEAGISAAYVTLALDELRRMRDPSTPEAVQRVNAPVNAPRPSPMGIVLSSPPAPPLAGAPTSIVYELELPGQLSPDVFDVVAQAIRTLADEPGVASALSRTLIWTANAGENQRLQVNVTAAGGRTRIHVEEHFDQLAGQVFGGIVGGGGGTIGASSTVAIIVNTHQPVLGLVVLAGILSTAYVVARTVYSWAVHRRSKKLLRLVEQLGEEIASLIASNS